MDCSNLPKEFLDSLEFVYINRLDRIIENNNNDSFEIEDLIDLREYLFEIGLQSSKFRT